MISSSAIPAQGDLGVVLVDRAAVPAAADVRTTKAVIGHDALIEQTSIPLRHSPPHGSRHGLCRLYFKSQLRNESTSSVAPVIAAGAQPPDRHSEAFLRRLRSYR